MQESELYYSNLEQQEKTWENMTDLEKNLSYFFPDSQIRYDDCFEETFEQRVMRVKTEKSAFLNISKTDLSATCPALPKVRYLIARKLPLSGLSYFRRLDHLRTLDLSGCQLRSLQGIENIKELTHLSLRGCKSLTNISDIANLNNLEYLSLVGCEELPNLRGIEYLQNLKYLNLKGCHSLRHIDNTMELKELQHLDLRSCWALEDINALKSLMKLKFLKMNYCLSIENLKSLPDLNLEEMNLEHCQSLQTLDGLQNFVNLKKLVLSNCKSLNDIQALKKMAQLTHLNLENCRSLTQFDALVYLRNLEYLNLVRCMIKSLHPIKKSRNLRSLYIRDCKQLSYIKTLKYLSNLQVLDMTFSFRLSSDLKILSNLLQLEELCIRGYQSILAFDEYGCKYLSQLPKLRKIDIRDTNINPDLFSDAPHIQVIHNKKKDPYSNWNQIEPPF